MSYTVHCRSEQATEIVIATSGRGRLAFIKFGAAAMPGAILDLLTDDQRFQRSLNRVTDVLSGTLRIQAIQSILDELESKGMLCLPDTLAALHHWLGVNETVRLLTLICNAALEPRLPDMLSAHACIQVQATHAVSSIQPISFTAKSHRISKGKPPPGS
jgi:hypothetical protein